MERDHRNMGRYGKYCFCFIALLFVGLCSGANVVKHGADVKMLGDEAKFWQYNGAYYRTFRQPSGLAENIDATWPPDNGTAGYQLTTDGAGVWTWGDPEGAAAGIHSFLNGSTHSDTTSDAVTRGSIVYGNSTPKWDELVLGAAGTILRSDGTDVAWSATTNITTLGTIGTGVWQGTLISVVYGGTGASTLTDGGVLLGSGTGAITPMAVLANGEIIVGDGATDPVALAAYTSSTGTLKHERGGLEADINAYTGLVAVSGGSTSEVDALSELEGQIADVTAFVVEGTACSDIEGTGLSIAAGTLNWAAAHGDSSDMPDSTGVITDHDTRLVAKVQAAAPTTPAPFEGMIWYDTDATGSSTSSTVNLVTKTTTYTITADDVVILCSGTFTATLPTAVGVTGKTYWIKNIGTGTITVDGDGSETVDSGTTAVLRKQHEAITVISDNTEWWIL